MENFVLYEEVGQGDHSTVYKGRRKGTINFVAIHCIEKCKRSQTTNLVRLSHEINHINVVKFYEWYETTNHLWLVVELCTGGSLETILMQDGHLPETSIRKFGIDLVQGLHHIHSLGIICSDIKPSKILLDGPGMLKFADFGLSRVEGENLKELFQQFSEAGESWTPDATGANGEYDGTNTSGSPTYMAPEVLQSEQYSMASDIWSLGCVLYEMFSGHPPFLAETTELLAEKIQHGDYPQPRVRGTRVSGKPSPEFNNLLEGLLQKNPRERLGWAGLVTHPFWEGALQHLAKDLETSADVRESAATLRASVQQSLAGDIMYKGNSVLGQVKDISLDERDGGASELGTLMESQRPDSTMSQYRPKTAPGSGDPNVSFTLGSRPMTAGTPLPDEHISPQKMMTQSPLNVKETLRRAKQELMNLDDKSEVQQLIFHASDFTLTPIVDNPKIQKPATLKYDNKSVPVPPYSVEKIAAAQLKDQAKHITAILEAVTAGEKGPPSQKRIHLLNYSASISSTRLVADLMVKHGAINILARLARDAQLLEIRQKLCRVLGLICHNATELDENAMISEAVATLTEGLRDNFRNGKVKVAILGALGELVYLIASQEEMKGQSVDNWNVATMTYTLLIRCLREGEDAIVNHTAAKIVENVAITSGTHMQKFASNEIGQMMWYVFTHATADSLRITALSALTRLARHQIGVFQSVIDKVGLPKLLSTMALPIPRIQQAIVTQFGALISSSESRFNRILQDKEFALHIIRLLESPSMVIRGKALLVLVEVSNNNEMLLHCINNRLVMYIERDSRRQPPSKSEGGQQWEYLNRCLDWLVNRLVDTAPSMMKELLSSLEAVSGRKHPSTVQVKQLKQTLPMATILQHFVGSQVLRSRIINEGFLKNLSSLLNHIRSIDAGTTGIQAATGQALGAAGSDDFIHSVFSIVEAIAQHPSILVDNLVLMVDKMLPALAGLVSSSSAETRALALRLFSEIAPVFLNQQLCETSKYKMEIKRLHQLICESLLPQYEQILLEADPVPSYGLKLLLALMESSSMFVREFDKMGLTPVLFQVLVDHQNNPVSPTMLQIVSVINCLVSHKDINLRDLYAHGLVDHLSTLFLEVTALAMSDQDSADKSPSTVLQSLLDTLHFVLKHVSEVVRKALQAKKGGSAGGNKEAEQAEQLLLKNKPFTDLISLLTQLLCHEDSDIQDLSLKGLSLLVQLFGGEHPDAMNPDNMECYSEALQKADGKKQKIILRIIKRMISTEKLHETVMREQGGRLAETIRRLVQTASSHAEVAVSTLAADILKTTGYIK